MRVAVTGSLRAGRRDRRHRDHPVRRPDADRELARQRLLRALRARAPLDELPELAATPIAPVGYTCADLWGDEAEAPLAAADVAFSYSVTWESEEGYLTTLSSLLARRLSDGARACTVDLKLRSDADASFDLLATVTGCNPETGEGTVGYVWRVRKPP